MLSVEHCSLLVDVSPLFLQLKINTILVILIGYDTVPAGNISYFKLDNVSSGSARVPYGTLMYITGTEPPSKINAALGR